MKPALSIVDRALGVLLVLGEVVVGVMCLHIVAEVLANWLFRSPIDGTPEIVARWYMVAIVFLPLASIQRRNGHIRAELFTRGLGPRWQAGLDVFIGLLMAALGFLLAWHGYGEAVSATVRREAIELLHASIPSWPTRWFVPLGFGTMGLVALLMAVQRTAAVFGRDPGESGGGSGGGDGGGLSPGASSGASSGASPGASSGASSGGSGS